MKIIGVRPRAVAVRSAANRLRWEVDYALGVALGAPERTDHGALDVSSSIHEIAETLAILRQVLAVIDEHGDPRLAEGDRERLRSLLLHYQGYHEVGR